MTLTTVPQYDSEQIADREGHAVVVGAGIAGLLAGRILADAFDEVTVLDRDPLPDEPVARPGVPQARQIHILWEAGRATLEELFPGYSEALRSAGGVVIDGQRDFYMYSQGGFLAAGSEPFQLYAATRPLYEQLLRGRVSELDGVKLRGNCPFLEYLADDGVTSVNGVMIRDDGAEQELAADLVVDATGRTSRTPNWLAKHGYTPPATEAVHVDLAYSASLIERPADDHRMIGVLAEAPRTRGGAVLPVEDNRWLVNLHGIHGDHPPTDVEESNDFAASLPTPIVKDLLEERPRVSTEIPFYPFPSNRRYRYEELDRFPDGLVVMGDAIANFNPIYGQGMSVAALEALMLHHTLATDDRKQFGRRFFDRATEVVEPAWMLATGADFSFPQTKGDKPRGTAFFNWYLGRLFRKAHTDSVLTDAFTRVLSMQQPPTSLLHPSVLWRVLRPGQKDTQSSLRESPHSHVPSHVEDDETSPFP
ncbi:FAD-dependent oxidoreductase [Natronorubrum thiooxidans]|uniref:Dehydrogenase (Flavoprotein) n=1 Tax=Natronorubrum thiooxidans TaxID=308853 RepID=A0A1N7FZN1_9EURY|nr:FAD-dependent monooxygenase [Natronorubrum thiooxidans]SIS05735.1 Dehydrogenase (flavoprotein) [Natronorubrum thiooxidans]